MIMSPKSKTLALIGLVYRFIIEQIGMTAITYCTEHNVTIKTLQTECKVKFGLDTKSV